MRSSAEYFVANSSFKNVKSKAVLYLMVTSQIFKNINFLIESNFTYNLKNGFY